MEVDKKSSSRSTTKTNCASKTAFHKTKTGKCQRPSGPLYRNPYLNFLREFRQRNCELSAVEIIRRGAKEWNNMPKENKLQYIEEAFYAPKKRKPPPPPQPKQQQQQQQQQQHQQQTQMQHTQMRMVSYPEDCGIVCPRMANACGKKRRKKRKAKCVRKRRPKKRRCAKRRRPKKKRKRCRI